jgi:type I restriction-modification system DNA methylase subunit
MRINIKNIEERVKLLAGKSQYDKELIFNLLAAYGRAPANITRLRNGQLNIANDIETEVAQKGVVYFKPTTDNVYTVIDELQTDATVIRYSTRFVIVTDFKKLLAFDIKTNEPLDIDIADIDKHFTFFLPWAGMEKAQYANENHADVKAAEKMAKLFDELNAFNKGGDAKYYHGLNVFLMRLLFCYFAEDTLTFKQGQFTKAIESYTQRDGSDVARVISELFISLDIEDKTGYPEYIKEFPYVNGSLFRGNHVIPEFNKTSRELLLKCGKLNWSKVNPDIFGSMIQAVVNPGQRAGLGMHYTSVPNILKTIEPLFLEELKEEFNKHYDDVKKLEKLLGRIGSIKVFDPACGSGNFLIIAYKELRKLEHAILERQADLGSANRILFSRISIENFYGIEIDDFAHEVAILSLWIAKHQMNLEFAEKFGVELPLIPLKEAGNIVQGNAARLDWDKVCPNNPRHGSRRQVQGTLITQPNEQAELPVDGLIWDEIYLIGNPPYLGSKRQDRPQKNDIEHIFKPVTNKYKDLDYISIWFYKGAKYIAGTRAKLAFVSTNSISQGTHVEMIWPLINALKTKIMYVYNSFKWSNSAKGGAGVTCVIIALSDQKNMPKTLRIYDENISREVSHINAYLTDGPDLIIGRRSSPLSLDLPKMKLGNMAVDDGNFFFNRAEKKILVDQCPQVEKYLRRVYGSYEYINAIERYCLWVSDDNVENVSKIPEIQEIAAKVSKFRKVSKDASTRKMANKPYQFREMHMSKKNTIILPRVSSDRREYIPFGFLDAHDVVSDSAQALYDAEPYVFGLISSRMHMSWARAVAGRLKTDLRYSSAIVYNNFPVPPLAQDTKQAIEERVFAVLDARENHTELTLAEMYDPDKIPEDLRKAHNELDNAVDSAYRKKQFENDEERLAYLFDLYEEMTKNERNNI